MLLAFSINLSVKVTQGLGFHYQLTGQPAAVFPDSVRLSLNTTSRSQDCLGRQDQPAPHPYCLPLASKATFVGTLLPHVMGSSGVAGWEGPGTGLAAEPQGRRPARLGHPAQLHKCPAPGCPLCPGAFGCLAPGPLT